MSIDDFLSQYDEEIYIRSLKLRDVILKNLPDVTEQVDVSAKMVAYCYGQKYTEMIGMLIPSKKGLKFSFYKGVDLPDPTGMLQGDGKITRYVAINSDKEVKSAEFKKLIKAAYVAYKNRIKMK